MSGVSASSSASASAVSRWLSAVSLIAAADAAQLADIPSQNTVAVATSHAAAELLLGLIAGPGFAVGLKGERFPHLVTRAQSRANQAKPGTFDAQLADDLLQLNTVRNAALHEGVPVASSAASDACSTARGLLAAAPGWIPTLPTDTPGGIASAVALLVDVPPIRDGLRLAEEHLAADRLREAVETVEEVLDVVLSWAGLPTQLQRPLPSWTRAPRVRGSHRTVDDVVQSLAGNAHREERWVLRLAIGTRQRDLKRLSAITTSMRRPGDPSRRDAEWALSRLVEITYRLWSGGVLEAPLEEGDGLPR
jgi:hypothetical protein